MTHQVAALLGMFVKPEHVRIDESVRARAAARIDDARTTGLLGDDQAAAACGRLARAGIRGDVRSALTGVPRAVAPIGLSVGLQAAAVPTLVVSAIQFVIWAAI